MVNPIEIRNLSKSFGNIQALDGLDLIVAPGEVRGFLGPNGSGKSTTIRILLGLLRADSGDVRLFDGDPWDDAVSLHKRIAYVPGDVTLWPNLTGGEAIDYLNRLHGVADLGRREELLERFELDPTRKASTYSKGNRQKVALVAALSVDADLYILDEPTSGLDPLMEAVFVNYIQELKAQGRSVLLSSHILSEVEKVCDTVTIIRAGSSVESGTLSELRHLTRSRVIVTIAGDPGHVTETDGFSEPTLELNDGLTTATFDVEDHAIGSLLEHLATLDVRNITITPPSLEDLFMRHYSEDHAQNLAHEVESGRK